jgi:hypothetical protein
MFNVEQLELQLEIAELQELGLSQEEIHGYLEVFWTWKFEPKEDKYGIQ